MGEPDPNYKVIPRSTGVILIVLVVLFLGAAVLAMQHFTATWLQQFNLRVEHDPAGAAYQLREILRWFFSLVPLLLTLVSVPVIRQGLAGLRSGFMPPPGAWILAGQRTHVGAAARWRARLQWIVGVLMLVAVWVDRCWATSLLNACCNH